MDLSNPARIIMPSVTGAVLRALSHTCEPLSGRAVAALAGDGVGYRRASQVLGELTEAGVVIRESVPPAYSYRLNRDHVAAEAIATLADLRARLMARISETVGGWDILPVAVWLFGSAARGDGTSTSDIDLLVVRPANVSDSDPLWTEQLASLAERVTAWSGNDCQIVEYSPSELAALVADDEALVGELRVEAIVLVGKAPSQLLRSRRSRS
jgi:hypothetical protein